MSISRRDFCAKLALASAISLPAASIARPLAPWALDADRGIFQHGVASGDPLHDRVILWTRVSPTNVDGLVPVKWAIATDPNMRRVVNSGRVYTSAGRDHTVKIDASGLRPGVTYYYRFECQGALSPIGRTRTLPVEGHERLRLAVASCSNYPYGFFNVYGLIARRADLDAVLHLGDYIYEYGNGQYGDGAALGRVPQPDREIVTLQDYRLRHATYKSDADLQEAHRQHPFIVVWDDHESANDSWEDGAQNHQPETEGDWQERKQRSIQAYFEWMPIRPRAKSRESIYRHFRFGQLAELDMLDTRLLARDRQAAGPADMITLNDPARTLLGEQQERWFLDRLSRSQAGDVQWRLVGQQVMFAQLSADGGAHPVNVDQWDGYRPARGRIIDHLESRGIDNVVILTGDIHSSWANDIARNPFDPTSYDPVTGRGAVAVEFVTPGVTSPGIVDPVEAAQTAAFLRLVSPHMKHIDLNRRGYMVLDIDRDRVQGEWYHPDTVAAPSTNESFGRAFYAQAGQAHLVEAVSPAEPKPAPDPAP